MIFLFAAAVADIPDTSPVPLPPARYKVCDIGKRIAFHAFNAIDKTMTVVATHRGAHEANPLLKTFTGKRVSVLEGAAAFAVTSGMHELLLSRSCAGQTVAVGVQGAAAVYMTVRFLF